ncbi:MAG: LacI family DNA-binding transcriptional regulator [Chloroflexota bacterium]
MARSLVSKRTLSVGLLISDVGNPFYSEVIRGVEDVAAQQDYSIFLCNTSYDHTRGLKYIQSLINKQVDGVLLMSSSVSDEWVEELARSRTPVVALDWWPTHPVQGAVRVIGVDFETGIRQAVDHLVQLGHTRFAHISGPMSLRTSRTRRQAFLSALEEHGFLAEQITMIEANLRLDGGRGALEQLVGLPDPPTAVFAANDLTAIGLVWAAQQRGLKIPEHLSVIGLDDIQLAAEILPPLTTVAMPRGEIGRMAMEMLLELIDDAEPETQVQPAVNVPTSLVVRQSSGPVPQQMPTRFSR